MRDWIAAYDQGETPWDTNRPDGNLVRQVLHRPIMPCKTLEIGCGTGISSIWLALQGFQVTALDLSSTALTQAKLQAEQKQVEVRFLEEDFLNASISGAPFDLIVDRGVHHVFSLEERVIFAKNAVAHLKEGGLWLSLLGSKDGPPREVGPPRLSAMEVAQGVEEAFEILSLETGAFDLNGLDTPRGWVGLFRKREQYS